MSWIAYVDFRRLYVIHQAGAFFVTRTKINMKYHRVYSRVVDKTTGVISDQAIAPGKHLVFLTNNCSLSAAMIAAL
jgi:hypothetical protein